MRSSLACNLTLRVLLNWLIIWLNSSYIVSLANKLTINFQSLFYSGLDEKIFLDCLKFMENHLEKPAGKKAFEKFYTESGGRSPWCRVEG